MRHDNTVPARIEWAPAAVPTASQDSGQDNLLGLCRLDPLGGRVRLEDRAGFLELLGAEVPTSASEPAQLLIDSPRQTRPACPEIGRAHV